MKILFLPDMMLPSTSKSIKNLNNLEIFLSNINKKFNNHDFIINLESVLLSKTTSPVNQRDFNIYSNEDIFKIVTKYNIKNISLSNNHIFDFGYDGFKQTVHILKKNNLRFFGAGEDLHQARKPIVFKDKENKSAIFGMSYKPLAQNKKPGVFSLKDMKSLKFIKNYKLKNKDTFVIIYCHSGLELFEYPLINDEIYYKKLIDFGADLIIGSHPHRIQGFEKYKNKFIFYSIGDLFGENTTKKDWLNYITKPAHASIYKQDLDNKMLFQSYMLEIDTQIKTINLYHIMRDIYFNYKYKKITNDKIIKMTNDYAKKLKSKKVKKYRELIEKQVFGY